MGRIAPNKKGRRRQFQPLVQDPCKEWDESALAMLGAVSQFNFHEPPLQGQLGCHRGITVKSLVGAEYSLLFGVGVVHGENAYVQRDIPSGNGRH